jgi:hypothetical protein
MGELSGDMLTDANQAIQDARAMVAAPTQPGATNPCRDALIANFGTANPTVALQQLRTTGGALQVGPNGLLVDGPQNVFNGNLSSAQVGGTGNPTTVSQFLADNPSVSAVTADRNIFLDDSFVNDRGRLGRAQDIIHEAVVHRANNVRDSAFAPANSTNPRQDGSRRINEIIRQSCNRLPN